MQKSISNDDLMKFLISSHTIDLDDVERRMIEEEQKRILGKHKYKVFKDKDGRWKTTLPDKTKKSGRRLVAKSSLESLNNAIIEFYTLEEDKEICEELKTIRDIYPEWIRYKALEVGSPSYLKRINADWIRYYEKDSIVDKEITSLSYLDIKTWCLNLVINNNMTRKQYFNATVIIRQLLDYCVDKELIQSNPMKRVKVDKKKYRTEVRPDNNTQVYFQDEQEKIKRAALERYEQMRYKYLTPLAIILNFNLGLRIGELVALKWTDIEDNYITIQRSEIEDYEIREGSTKPVRVGVKVVERTKTEKGVRTLYLTEEAREILHMAKKTSLQYGYYDNDFIFISKYNTRITEDGMAKYLYDLCKYAGLDHKSSHKIRKTFISGLFDVEIDGEKLNIDTIKDAAGHKDARTTYNNYCFDTKRNKTNEKLFEKNSVRVV